MIKIPYGISNFERLISNGYYFDDTTPFIEKLEGLDTSYHFFMRPRRFGKTLFVSMLSYYYGIEHKDKFEQLFGKLYIGSHPSPKVNAYHILHFEFSRIDTTSAEATLNGFLKNVRSGIISFFQRYPIISKEEISEVLQMDKPSTTMVAFFTVIKNRLESPIYLLIDEYDHFANEILAFHFKSFADMVSRNGFVRKFYEAIKTATSDNVVERLFVTGVTPITLDSLTSGFNIRTDLSRAPSLNGMMGFSSKTVQPNLKGFARDTTAIPSR